MHSESPLRTVMIDKGQKTARRRRFAATYRNMLFRFSCGRRRQKIPQWKCNVSLHNYISAVAIKLYRPRISFLQLPSGRRRHLFASPLSSFLMLCSLRSGSTRNRRDWRRRLKKKKKNLNLESPRAERKTRAGRGGEGTRERPRSCGMFRCTSGHAVTSRWALVCAATAADPPPWRQSDSSAVSADGRVLSCHARWRLPALCKLRYQWRRRRADVRAAGFCLTFVWLLIHGTKHQLYTVYTLHRHTHYHSKVWGHLLIFSAFNSSITRFYEIMIS